MDIEVKIHQQKNKKLNYVYFFFFKIYFYFSIYVLELILLSPVLNPLGTNQLKKVSLHRDKLKTGHW